MCQKKREITYSSQICSVHHHRHLIRIKMNGNSNSTGSLFHGTLVFISMKIHYLKSNEKCNSFILEPYFPLRISPSIRFSQQPRGIDAGWCLVYFRILNFSRCFSLPIYLDCLVYCVWNLYLLGIRTCLSLICRESTSVIIAIREPIRRPTWIWKG